MTIVIFLIYNYFCFRIVCSSVFYEAALRFNKFTLKRKIDQYKLINGKIRIFYNCFYFRI